MAVTVLCANPSLDWTLDVPVLTPGDTHRVLRERIDPGGKGVNVARTLSALDVPVRYVGLHRSADAERFSAALFGIETHFCALPGETRRNLKITNSQTGQVTEINSPGEAVSQKDGDALLSLLLDTAKDGEWVVLSGSLPPGLPADFYGRAVAQLRQKGCKVALDASGAALSAALPNKPALIKPNRAELLAVTGGSAVFAAARQIAKSGVIVCASLGKDGAILDDGARVFRASSPTVPVRGTVGAGDTLLAGLIAALQNDFAPDAALRFAVACATASVQKPGTQIITLAEARVELARMTESSNGGIS